MSPRYTLRLLAFVVLLLLAVPVRTAGATSHAATSDDGASGGGSGSADTSLIEQTLVLVGSGAEREEIARDQAPVLVGSGAEREEVASEADWSEAETVRGVLSPIDTEAIAAVEPQDIASGESESAGTQNELTINGVRIE
jgi:hypothetical protein